MTDYPSLEKTSYVIYKANLVSSIMKKPLKRRSICAPKFRRKYCINENIYGICEQSKH